MLEAQAYVRRLHSYLEPRMLRRLKHNTLLGELPAKVGGRGRGGAGLGGCAYSHSVTSLQCVHSN